MFRCGEVERIESAQFIENIPNEILEKVNKKQLKAIVKMLEEHNISANNKIKLAFNIYLSIGFARARDLLNTDEGKNYGPISEYKLEKIFGNINIQEVMLQEDGNGYSPVLNEEWINMLFVTSYKVLNTPIRNILGNCIEYNV